MVPANESDTRIPIICADESGVVGAEIFNANFWTGASKGIIQSCWTEYSVLHHCVGQIVGMCGEAERLCGSQIKTIQQQWSTRKFDLGKVIIYGQQPDLHMRIEAFFAGVKTLLDLIVQLLSSEKVVGGGIDGFHRAQDVYGGKVLNALARNARSDRKETAARAMELITLHKASWIDQAVLARDQLIHPRKGMHQVMFQIELAEKHGELVGKKVIPPQIDSLPIDRYAQDVLKHARDFSLAFLALFREAAVSNQRLDPT
jgi:hypothetical protein